MVKYLILGNGFIGNRLNDLLPASHLDDIRIKSVEDAERVIVNHVPKYIINCIGKTGRPNVDWCEDHKEETMFSNVVVPTMIAIACGRWGDAVKMVHIGSGCIYENTYGEKTEDDEPNFYGSFYSRTKIMAERALKEFDNVLQLRIRMPVDFLPDDRNLITKLVKFDNVIDFPNSVTTISTLVEAIGELCRLDKKGIFNVVEKGPITHPEILELYRNIIGDVEYDIISIKEMYKLVNAPRSNCILATRKLEREMKVYPVEKSISKCLKFMRGIK